LDGLAGWLRGLLGHVDPVNNVATNSGEQSKEKEVTCLRFEEVD
jgi:hypothetical protein